MLMDDAWLPRAAAQGELRIAHCGGVHLGLDSLIRALNFVARLLGHPFRWCGPPHRLSCSAHVFALQSYVGSVRIAQALKLSWSVLYACCPVQKHRRTVWLQAG